jgi:crotonobetainyl-CoA:carnitine CoA-transferase CaiB-like acyl-CoA transferase
LQNEREWKVFCDRVLQQPALATDERFASNPKRVQARGALRALILEVFATLTAEQIVERLEAAQIANARVNGMHEVWHHAQLHARRRFTEVQTPAGPVAALRPPALPDSFEPRMGPVPAVCEHTDAVLRELGYDAAAIAELHATGAV